MEEKNWYVVNTYAGHENKVKDNIVRRIESMGMQENIFRVIVAEYEEPVKKDGEIVPNKFKTKNLYPGYIFVEMIMSDEAWFVIRNTPGVTGFIGSSGKGVKPFPVGEAEMDAVLKRVGLAEGIDKDTYCVGDMIKILNGPFVDNICKIEAVDEDKRIVKVQTLLFGRLTEVELSFNDIIKY